MIDAKGAPINGCESVITEKGNTKRQSRNANFTLIKKLIEGNKTIVIKARRLARVF